MLVPLVTSCRFLSKSYNLFSGSTLSNRCLVNYYTSQIEQKYDHLIVDDTQNRHKSILIVPPQQIRWEKSIKIRYLLGRGICPTYKSSEDIETMLYSEIIRILIQHAPRGMGSQCNIVTQHLFKSSFTDVTASYKSTVSRFIAGTSGVPIPVRRAIQTSCGQDIIQQDVAAFLKLLPGVAARHMINQEVFALVQTCDFDDNAKLQLIAKHTPDTIDVDTIAPFVARVLIYSLGMATSSTSPAA